ncbi:hypothetical protein SLS58_003093 [Diplodia intermedia]|uniref:Fungal N-terminal domain-containing protein n=1 Tax=Diplodia intermedia TaxID=856260 RepID=A0ABR3TXN5_9PEZI
MADPVSLLGTLPALVTLPAVVLQASQTIKGFAQSVKNAPQDVQTLMQDVEHADALFTEIKDECARIPAEQVSSNDREHWQRTSERLLVNLEQLSRPLRDLHSDLNKPSLLGLDMRARFRKYLSEARVASIRAEFASNKGNMSILFHKIQENRARGMQESQGDIKNAISQLQQDGVALTISHRTISVV